MRSDNVFLRSDRPTVAVRLPYVQIFASYCLLGHTECSSASNIGKILASFFDVLVAYTIYKIVLLVYAQEKKALQCAQLWLYNPLPIIISTRGNLDAVSSLFVLLTLYYQLKENYLASGALLAVSTHLRLYPIVFALPLLVTAGRITSAFNLRNTYKDKLKFLSTFATTLASLTGIFYYVYGFKFIEESILYHVYRKDVQHNFSLYFYVQYLDAFVPDYVTRIFTLFDPKITKALLIIVPQIVLLIAVTVKYNTLRHLAFNLYCSAFIFVVFNKVLTSQYFVWFLSLLPLFLPSITISKNKVIGILSAWIGSQAAWLASAYLLEFEGRPTFAAIHGSSILFFSVNVWILSTFINAYNTQYLKKVD
ncbi:hypothetical protein U1Q18_049845 [Sarracenia purpurea var. burkii]